MSPVTGFDGRDMINHKYAISYESYNFKDLLSARCPAFQVAVCAASFCRFSSLFTAYWSLNPNCSATSRFVFPAAIFASISSSI